MKNKIISYIEDANKAKRTLISQIKKIEVAIDKISACCSNGNKILLCGNGGSAADAQHLAAEMIVRLRSKINRKAYPAMSLAMDSSTLTACGNDYSFDDLFSRSLEAFAKPDDVLIAISTSGNSKNILNVLKRAKQKKIYSIGFFGNNGGKAKNICNLPLIVRSTNTARIQETQIFLGHFILENVENNLISKK